MNSDNNQRIRLTKRLFHEALLSLLNEKSIDRITVKELCEKAGLNRTTFYLHYGEPENVLTEIENDLIDQTRSYFLEIRESNVLSRLQAMLEYIRENRDMFRTLMCEHSSDSFRLHFFEEIFPSGIADERFKMDDSLRKYVNGYLVGGAFAAVYTWINSDFALPVHRLALMICGMSESAADYCCSESSLQPSSAQVSS